MTWILEHPYEVFASFLAVTTGLAIMARLIIAALGQWAKTTPSTHDDEVIASWAAKADAAVAILDVIRRCLPRVVVGPWPTTQPIASVSKGNTVAPMKPISGMPPAPLIEAAIGDMPRIDWPPSDGGKDGEKPS